MSASRVLLPQNTGAREKLQCWPHAVFSSRTRLEGRPSSQARLSPVSGDVSNPPRIDRPPNTPVLYAAKSTRAIRRRKGERGVLSRTIMNFCRTSSACNTAALDPIGNCVLTRRSNSACTSLTGPCKPSPMGARAVVQPAETRKDSDPRVSANLIESALAILSLALRPIQLILADHRIAAIPSGHAMSRSEHSPPRGLCRRKSHESYGAWNIIVDRFHATLH